MADSTLGNYSDYVSVESKSSRGLNKDSKEFTPILSVSPSPWLRQSNADELSTLSSSALDDILKQAASIESRRGSKPLIVSPIPSTAHVTPQMSAVMLPPPPGYAPIDEPEEYYPFLHQGHKLFVGALPYSVSEMDLFPLFNQFGDILELHVQRDWLGRSKGCAWLRYSTIDECHSAILALHNNYYLGSMNRPMQLTFASEERKARTESFEARPRANTDEVPSLLSKLRTMSQSEQQLGHI